MRHDTAQAWILVCLGVLFGVLGAGTVLTAHEAGLNADANRQFGWSVLGVAALVLISGAVSVARSRRRVIDLRGEGSDGEHRPGRVDEPAESARAHVHSGE